MLEINLVNLLYKVLHFTHIHNRVVKIKINVFGFYLSVDTLYCVYVVYIEL